MKALSRILSRIPVTGAQRQRNGGVLHAATRFAGTLAAVALVGITGASCAGTTGSNAVTASAPRMVDPGARIMQRLSALSADSMEGRRAGTPGGRRARNWIIRELSSSGIGPYGTDYEHPVKLQVRPDADSMGANVIALVKGRSRNAGSPILVLSAHYDHLGIRNGEVYNGADDDASGAIAVLTIGEWLMRDRPEHDVILAFFDAEEGGLRGARAFVADEATPLSRIALNINLDMVSRQDGNAIWVAGLSHYPGLRELAEKTAATSHVPVRFGHDTPGGKPGDNWTNSSDHGAFHAKGIPFLYLGVEDHPDYHRPGDDVDKIDPVFYRGVIDFAYDLVRAADRELSSIHASGGRQ